MTDENDLVYRLKKRAEIRRNIPHRKSVQEGKADRMADLLDEAASEIDQLRNTLRVLKLSIAARLSCDDPGECLSGLTNEEFLKKLFAGNE